MRRVLCLSLCLGLCLAVAGTARAQHGAPVSNTKAPRLNAGPLCEKCVAKMEKRVSADPRDVALAKSTGGTMLAEGHQGAHADCAVCESATGIAYVGHQGNDAPGYASVGGGSEPAPIGVMQVAHRNPEMGNVSHAQAPLGRVQAGPMVSPPTGPPMASSGINRRHLIGHVLGLPRLGGFSEARNAKRKEEHAAIRYDSSVSQASSLPASMVYSR